MNPSLMSRETGKINIVLQQEQEKQMIHEHVQLQYIEEQLQRFVGLDELKDIVKNIYATAMINEQRGKYGLALNEQAMHMIFTGNPGTGKTTVARKLATVLKELQLLSKGQFIEAQRADIVGEYIGQTALKTKKLVQEALGGVLFIDEAYALARGGHKDFGREAIDTLVKMAEDHRHDCIVILAGYPDEMDYFLLQNPGLRSRFPFQLNFPNYSVDQLVDIAKLMVQERDYTLTERAIWKMKNHLRRELMQDKVHFSNGRYVRNMIEEAIRHHSTRLIRSNDYGIHALTSLQENDFILENDV
ncbi:MAG TPA: AAA family ATPase [Pseudogracilibacillus sp.]|nr:AAA family ATPase [Pseudogracilibacillus sp.]